MLGFGLSYGLYVNTNNTIYVTDPRNNRIQVWFNNSTVPSMTIYGNLSEPLSIFVTALSDIYVYNGYPFHRVDKVIPNMKESVSIMFAAPYCYGLFVDISNTIYCAIFSEHKVVKKWLGYNTTALTTVAGNGSAGSASNMLYNPNGIFVDINFDLYIADFANNRIQLFRYGEMNGITAAGSTTSRPTIALRTPTAVVLDADKYLFIVDRQNHRIVGQDSNGFRCLVGCSCQSGSSSNQLNYPQNLYFDSYGNMFVTDVYNNRVQKFVLVHNKCDM